MWSKGPDYSNLLISLSLLIFAKKQDDQLLHDLTCHNNTFQIRLGSSYPPYSLFLNTYLFQYGATFLAFVFN